MSPGRSGSDNREAWLVLGMLLLTVIIPLQVKSYSDEGNSPLLAQVVWSAAYLAAGFRNFALAARGGTVDQVVRNLDRGPGTRFRLIALVGRASTTFKNAVELVGTTVVGLYIVARFRMSEFMTILMLFFAASALMSAALIFGSPGRGHMFYGSGPWDGIYQDKNSLGAAMATAIIVYLIYLFRPGVPRKPLVFVGLLFCGALLVGSSSITATLVCAGVLPAGVLAYSCVSPRYGILARALSVAVAAFGFIVFALFGFDAGKVYALVGRSSKVTGRAGFWPYLLEAIRRARSSATATARSSGRRLGRLPQLLRRRGRRLEAVSRPRQLPRRCSTPAMRAWRCSFGC